MNHWQQACLSLMGVTRWIRQRSALTPHKPEHAHQLWIVLTKQETSVPVKRLLTGIIHMANRMHIEVVIRTPDQITTQHIVKPSVVVADLHTILQDPEEKKQLFLSLCQLAAGVSST